MANSHSKFNFIAQQNPIPTSTPSATQVAVAPKQQESALLDPMPMLSSSTISSTTSTTVQPSPVTSAAHSQSSMTDRKDSSNESKEYKNIVSTDNKKTEKAYTVRRLKGQNILIDRMKEGKSKNGLKVKAMLTNNKFKLNLYELASNHDLPYPIFPITAFLASYMYISSDKKKHGKIGPLIDRIVLRYRTTKKDKELGITQLTEIDKELDITAAWKVKLATEKEGEGQEKTGLLFNQRMIDVIILKISNYEDFKNRDTFVIRQTLEEMLTEYQALYPNSNTNINRSKESLQNVSSSSSSSELNTSSSRSQNVRSSSSSLNPNTSVVIENLISLSVFNKKRPHDAISLSENLNNADSDLTEGVKNRRT